jgi:hypothetical protein
VSILPPGTQRVQRRVRKLGVLCSAFSPLSAVKFIYLGVYYPVDQYTFSGN